MKTQVKLCSKSKINASASPPSVPLKRETKEQQNGRKKDDEYLKPSARIINGETVKSNEDFPFVVDLSGSDTEISSKRFCTGTLIDHNTILTAAHCVINQGYVSPVYATIGRIELEDNHIDNKPSSTYRTIASMVHPLYNGIGSPYDVAILLLNESCESIRPVSLTTQTPPLNSKPWVVGYGIQRIGTAEEVTRPVKVLAGRLQKSQLEVIDRKYCDIPQADLHTEEGLLCTKGIKLGASACMGDSGGGLFLKNDTTSLIKQVGIVSYGDSQCASEESGVFTDVSHVLKWIRSSSGKLEGLIHSSTSLQLVLNDNNKSTDHYDHMGGKMLVHFKSNGVYDKHDLSNSAERTVFSDYAHHTKYYSVSTKFSKPTNVKVSLCKSWPGTKAELSVRNERNDEVLSDNGSCSDGRLSELIVHGLKNDNLTIGVSGNGTFPIRLTLSETDK